MKNMRILMVCLGNICRSPMAEGLLQKKITDNNLNAKVDSAGTAAYHVEENPDPRAQNKMHEHGFNISNLKARQFDAKNDFQNFDYIFAMDSHNYKDLLSQAKNESDKNKIQMILNLISNYNKSVPDPYYGGEDGFETVFQLLDKATDIIVEKIIKKN